MRRTTRNEWIRLRGSLVMFLIFASVLWGYWAMLRLAGLSDPFIEVGIILATIIAALGFVVCPIRAYRCRIKELAALREWMKAMSST